MGSKSAQIEREITEKRRLISEKMERLETRVRGDASGVRSMADDRLSQVTEQLDRSGVVEYIRQHPFSSVAGALGLGVLAGVVSESAMPSQEQKAEPSTRTNRPVEGDRIVDRLVGAIAGTAIVSIQDEVDHFVKEAFRGFGETEEERRRRVA